MLLAENFATYYNYHFGTYICPFFRDVCPICCDSSQILAFEI
jgi:hypothetical protein